MIHLPVGLQFYPPPIGFEMDLSHVCILHLLHLVLYLCQLSITFVKCKVTVKWSFNMDQNTGLSKGKTSQLVYYKVFDALAFVVKIIVIILLKNLVTKLAMNWVTDLMNHQLL